jgi:hypothetical protein
VRGGFSGADYTSQWLGSRMISAQQANTGNAFSLGLGSRGTVIALSSANLYSAVQPGGSLFGLQASNPVDTDVAYGDQPGLGPTDPPPSAPELSARLRIRWSASASAASMYSAAALRSM